MLAAKPMAAPAPQGSPGAGWVVWWGGEGCSSLTLIPGVGHSMARVCPMSAGGVQPAGRGVNQEQLRCAGLSVWTGGGDTAGGPVSWRVWRAILSSQPDQFLIDGTSPQHPFPTKREFGVLLK